ncbi:MAG: hypothetical protein KatS3mg105_4149 [Gemmatales bacterium]|nr:MAG: hypothetical protein KatS3mg105_4149 [Gemmatales bacterium]
MEPLSELAVQCLLFVGMATIVVSILIVMRYGFSVSPAHWLPPQRRRAVVWGWLEIIVVPFIGYFFVPGICFVLLRHVGFFDFMYGAIGESENIRQHREALWVMALSLPVSAGVVLAFLNVSSGARLYQMGLRCDRVGRDLAVGLVAWLVLTPVVFLINFVVVVVHHVLQLPVDEHLLMKVLHPQNQPFLSEWVLAVFAAVVAAPLFEEIMFRGVIQPYVCQNARAQPPLCLVTLLLSLISRSENFARLYRHGWEAQEMALALFPALFVMVCLAVFPFFWPWFRRWLPDVDAAGGIYATSLLFAAVHTEVWPTPIALFPLGLGLGFIAYRTQSIVSAFACHAIFNSLSCLMLLMEYGLK